MYVVAVIELRSAPEEEAQALAGTLGGTAYEHRLHLVGGSPAVVLSTPEREVALRVLSGLRARGHDAFACDAAAVVSSDRMVALRKPRFELGAIANDEARVDAEDVLALLRATHRTDLEVREEVKTKRFSAGRAIMTGGLLLSKTAKREETTRAHEATQVLYLFRRSGQTPWILREHGTNFEGLGAEIGPTSAQNFLTSVQKMRRVAPRAVYDERLLMLRRSPGPPVKLGSLGSESVSASSIGAIDLAAHLLALSISKRSG